MFKFILSLEALDNIEGNMMVRLVYVSMVLVFLAGCTNVRVSADSVSDYRKFELKTFSWSNFKQNRAGIENTEPEKTELEKTGPEKAGPEKTELEKTKQESSNQSIKAPMFSSSLMAKRIKTSVENALTAKGKVRTEQNSDFAISYDIEVRKQPSRYFDDYSSYGGALYGGVFNRPIRFKQHGSHFRQTHIEARSRAWSHASHGTNVIPHKLLSRRARNMAVLTLDIRMPEENVLVWRGKASKPIPRSVNKEQLDEFIDDLVARVLKEAFAVN
jgi:hypothetical protein